MRFAILAISAALFFAGKAYAQDATPPAPPATVGEPGSFFDEGKLLATGGVSNVEGAAGGGLATWALITGYGTRDSVGIDAHVTYVGLPDYSLWTPGVAVGLWDRVELSYARQVFNTEDVGAALGLGKNYKFDQDIWGAKVKVIGDAVYDQDSWLPQIAVGLQYKHNDRGAIIHAIGGVSDDGTDYYISATKLFLEQSLLLNATLRETKANQFGILGFGGDKKSGYSTEFEGSAAYLISRKFAVGAEYRSKPDNLGIAREDGAWDIFAAYFLCKNLSLTAAYVDLGNIVIKDHQQGVYLSLQAGL
ncbi:MAG TPA: DUF3034 family protein [Rhizomicrobium sp.]|nr:DUF3034 family protein [Rhizomicrobium sp.]